MHAPFQWVPVQVSAHQHAILYLLIFAIAVYAVCVLRDALCYSAPVRGVTMIKKASAQSLLQDYLIHYMSSSISFSNLILNLVLRVSSDSDSE